jgi:hypothetical protein
MTTISCPALLNTRMPRDGETSGMGERCVCSKRKSGSDTAAPVESDHDIRARLAHGVGRLGVRKQRRLKCPHGPLKAHAEAAIACRGADATCRAKSRH